MTSTIGAHLLSWSGLSIMRDNNKQFPAMASKTLPGDGPGFVNVTFFPSQTAMSLRKLAPILLAVWKTTA